MAKKSGKSSIMKKFVISLTTASDRREHIKAEFGKQSIHFEFFDAITPAHIYELSEKFSIDFSKNQRLSDGEKACLMSHICVWQKCLDEDLDYIAVFEDDICLGKNADLFLNTDWLKDINFDIIKLETFFEKVHIKHEFNHYDRKLERLCSPHMGAGAYVITQSAIKKVINQIQKTPMHNLMAIDHILFEIGIHHLSIYQLNPAVCLQQMFTNHNFLPSQLEQSRQDNTINSHFDDNITHKLSRLKWRLKRSIGKRTFYKIVEFV